MPTAKVSSGRYRVREQDDRSSGGRVGGEIPRFCYHERLSIAGNCRMCLVEVKPGPPEAAGLLRPFRPPTARRSSPTPPMVRRPAGGDGSPAHQPPLDCPICDQGGECDLQDRSMGYGRDDTRLSGEQARRQKKYMGPLIKTVMTRCIQCARDASVSSPEVARRAGYRSDQPRRRRQKSPPISTRPWAPPPMSRPLPGRRADVQALRLQRPALG